MDHGGITFQSQSALTAVNVHYGVYAVLQNKNVLMAECVQFLTVLNLILRNISNQMRNALYCTYH